LEKSRRIICLFVTKANQKFGPFFPAVAPYSKYNKSGQNLTNCPTKTGGGARQN
jgi:hypothetical protein